MKIRFLISLTTFLFLANLAQADRVDGPGPLEGFYVGGNLVHLNLSNEHTLSDGSNYEYKKTAIEAVGGFKYSPYIGGEARLGSTTADSKITYASLFYRVESANSVGKAYLLLGYSTLVLNAGSDDSTNYNGISYGGGVGFVVSDELNFNIEYRELVNDSKKNVNLTGLSAGVDYRF